MKFLNLFFALAITGFLSACNDSGTTTTTSSDTSTSPSETRSQPSRDDAGGRIKNGIQLQESGLKVEEAYLTNPDGTAVGEDNKIAVGAKIVLHLKLSGWQPEQGQVSIGASEEVKSDDGTTIAENKDIFANTGPVSSDDARDVSLIAEITTNAKASAYYDVTFRVWDKTKSNAVSGSYRFSVQ